MLPQEGPNRYPNITGKRHSAEGRDERTSIIPLIRPILESTDLERTYRNEYVDFKAHLSPTTPPNRQPRRVPK